MSAYLNTRIRSNQICALMRRINEREAQAEGTPRLVTSFSVDSDIASNNIDIDSSGNLLLVEKDDITQVYRVRKYTQSGSPNGSFAIQNPGVHEAIAVDRSNGEIYVWDDADGETDVYSSGGTKQRGFTTAAPSGTEIGASSKYYLADGTVAHRYTSTGTEDWSKSVAFIDITYLGSHAYALSGGTVYKLNASTGSTVTTWSADYSLGGHSAQSIAADTIRSRLWVLHTKLVVGAKDKWHYFDTGGTELATGELGEGGGRDWVLDAADSLIFKYSAFLDKVYKYAFLGDQTEFFRYPTSSLSDKESLGTPDGGSSVPALNALEQDSSGDSIRIRPNVITDMRAAIEALAPYFKNSATGGAWQWDTGSANDLYKAALGGSDTDWQGDISTNARMRETVLDEIDQVLDKLEASSTI